MVYRWLRGSGDAALEMVKKPNGEYTGNISEMDEAIRVAWKPVNRRYESITEPSVDKFIKRWPNPYGRAHGPRSQQVRSGEHCSSSNGWDGAACVGGGSGCCRTTQRWYI